MSSLRSRSILTALLAAAALLAGCGGGATNTSGSIGSPGGTLRVSLTDAPACGFDAVNVTVERVRVHQSEGATGAPGEAGWSELVLSPPRRVDLLQLTNGVLLELGQVALPAGRYQQIRLVLAANAGSPPANSVIPSGGSEVPLATPSGQTSGIKLLAQVDVPAGQTADVVLDFDACRSVVRRGNSGQYGLKPVVSVIPLLSAGAISGHVDLALLASGVSVTAQAGGRVVKATVPDGAGGFRLSPVPAGGYTVAITAAGRATRVVGGVPVVGGGNAVLATLAQPLALPPSPALGQVFGQVLPVAAEAELRVLQTVGAALEVEVAHARADGLDGSYAFTLPRADAQFASFGTGLLPLVFADVPGSGGRYVIEASAGGHLPSPARSLSIALGVAPVRQDFVLTPAP